MIGAEDLAIYRHGFFCNRSGVGEFPVAHQLISLFSDAISLA
jgi:hypothetical protein